MQQMSAHSQAPLPPIRELRPGPARGNRSDPGPDAREEPGRAIRPPRRGGRRAGAVHRRTATWRSTCAPARRTTTSKMDLSRVSSIAIPTSKTPRPAPEDHLPAQASSWARRSWVVGLLAGSLALLFGPWNGKRTDARADGDPDSPRRRRHPAAPAGVPIKVGVLHSRTGTMAISERAVIDATLLAIDEINETGRRARPAGRGRGRGWRIRPRNVRRQGREADHRGQGLHRLRLLDVRQPQDGAAGLREARPSALLSRAVRGAGAVAEHRLHRGRPQPADHPRGQVVRVVPEEEEVLPGRLRLRLPAHRQRDHPRPGRRASAPRSSARSTCCLAARTSATSCARSWPPGPTSS